MTPSSKIQLALAGAAASVEQIMGRQQQPTLNSPDKSAIAYYLATSDIPNAAGVITKTNKNNLEVKLLGLPANIVNSYGVNSCLSLVSTNELQQPYQLQIKSKEGLLAKAQVLPPTTADSVQVGDFVQESVRLLARNLGLTLGLDADLQRIERVDATSALANISVVDSTVVLGEQNADCLLGKVNNEQSTASKQDNQTFSYGLYNAGGNLIGKTSGLEEEAVKIAIDRLKPHFNDLLAAKWLGLTNNEFSAKLKVDVSLFSGVDNQNSVLQKATWLSQLSQSKQPEKKLTFFNKNPLPNSINNVPVLIKGSDVQLSLQNTGDRELYVLLLGIDADSNIFALYTPAKAEPTATEAQLSNMAIAAGTELVIPPAENSWKWKVSDSIGINTLYVIFSIKPFAQTLKALAAQQNLKLDQQQVLNVVNPTVVVRALMEDLHTASSVSADLLLADNNVYALDVNSWASLNFVYEVSNA